MREHPTNPRQCRDPRFVGVRSGTPRTLATLQLPCGKTHMGAAGRSWAEDGLAAPARTLPTESLSDARDRRHEEMPAGRGPAEAPSVRSSTAPLEAWPRGVATNSIS